LRLQVVRVEIAGREHVGARQDSPLDLGAETFAAVAHVKRGEVVAGRGLGAVTKAHAVEARQIRRRLGRRDDVVRRHRQVNVLELDALQLGAELLELRERRPHGSRIVGVEAAVEEALGHADRDVLPRLADDARIGRHRLLERRRVALVEPGHRFEQQRCILRRLREHARLVEARGERDHAVARHAPVRRLEARDARERGRLANRAAGVGTGGRRYEARRDCRGRASGRTAGHERAIPWITDGSIEARLVRRAHRELVHVRFAQHDGAGALQALDDRRVVGRDEIVEHSRAAGRFHAGRAEDVFMS
jgi:hypothetical protein